MRTITEPGLGAPSVTVHGYCGLSPAQIARAIESGQAGSLVDASGHFVIVQHDPRGDVIVSSRSGVVGYFVTADLGGGRRAHGPDVASAVRGARLRHAWDHAGVADYLVFGHPLGAATAHPQVARVAGGNVIRLPGRGVWEQHPVPETPPQRQNSSSSPGDAVHALLSVMEADVPEDCALSLSGGLDSRLLLAASLALGRRPHLVISGIPGSFDREVATGLGQRLNLPMSVTAVTADDVVGPLPSIARVTNGLIPADNWAGIAHLRSAPPGDVPVMLGFNGEIARLYYAPQNGLGTLLAARSVPHGDRPVLLGQHFGSPFSPQEQRWLAPELRAALEPAAIAGRLRQALTGTRPVNAFELADRLFREGYGWQKLSNDLAVVGQHTRWRVPLFAPEFTQCVRSLPLRWKAGDRFHRYAIARLCHPLLDAPEEGYGSRTTRHVPARYWLRGPRPSRSPFLDLTIFQRPDLLDLVLEHREGLAGLLDPPLLDRLVAEQLAGPRRSHVVFRLLGLALWAADS